MNEPYNINQQLIDLRKLVEEVHDTLFTEPDKYNCIIRTPNGETLSRVLFGIDVIRKQLLDKTSVQTVASAKIESLLLESNIRAE